MNVCMCVWVWRDGRNVSFQVPALMGLLPLLEFDLQLYHKALVLNLSTFLMYQAKVFMPFTPLEFQCCHYTNLKMEEQEDAYQVLNAISNQRPWLRPPLTSPRERKERAKAPSLQIEDAQHTCRFWLWRTLEQWELRGNGAQESPRLSWKTQEEGEGGWGSRDTSGRDHSHPMGTLPPASSFQNITCIQSLPCSEFFDSPPLPHYCL